MCRSYTQLCVLQLSVSVRGSMNCFVCGQARGPAHIWKEAMQAAEDLGGSVSKLYTDPRARPRDAIVHDNIGRMCYEQGLSPCCIWGTTGAARHLLRRKRKLEERVDGPAGALGLIRPGNGLDRSFLDGYMYTPRYSTGGIQIGKHACSISMSLAQGPGSIATKSRRGSVAQVTFKIHCTVGATVRTTTVKSPLPAPINGYIDLVDKKIGGRLCVNLRIIPKINEIITRERGASTISTTLLGPTCTEELDFVPQNMRLIIQWKESMIQACHFKFKDPSAKPIVLHQKEQFEAKVSLAHVLRSLLHLPSGPMSEYSDTCDIHAEVVKLLRESLMLRTPMLLRSGGLIRAADDIVEGILTFLKGDLLILPNPEEQRNADAAATILLRTTEPHTVERGMLILHQLISKSSREIAPWKAIDNGAVYPQTYIDNIADALDMIARLLCAAMRRHANPHLQESPERPLDIISPSSVSSTALHRAMKTTLDSLVKDIRTQIRKSEVVPVIQAPGCIANGSNIKHEEHTNTHALRILYLEWPDASIACPLCGNSVEGNGICLTCAEDLNKEREHAAVKTQRKVVMRPGSVCWWATPYNGLLQSVAFFAQADNTEIESNLMLRKLVASTLVHDLPQRIIHKLKGRGAGIHATSKLQDKTKLRPRVGCVRSDDVTLHDATTVQTGIRSSQVQSAWRRRRANRRYRGLWDTLSLHEKTPQHTRHTPPGILFSPSALIDAENERTAVEAMMSALDTVKKLYSAPEPCNRTCFASVTVEGKNLLHSVAKWQSRIRTPDLKIWNGKDAPRSNLTLEQAIKLPRCFREELDTRMREFYCGEYAGVKGPNGEKIIVQIMDTTEVTLDNDDTIVTNLFTLGNRLPRKGDWVQLGASWRRVQYLKGVQVKESANNKSGVSEEKTYFLDPLKDLDKLPQRHGDPVSLSPLAYVNAILSEHERRVDLRLNGGHVAVLVQRAKLTSTSVTFAHLHKQLAAGELGLWHTTTMATEEHILSPKNHFPPGTYSLPFGEREVRCARANATPPPMGHGVRHGALMRAIGGACSVWTGAPTPDTNTPPLTCEASPSLLSTSAWSRGDISVTGARADVALFAVALIDDIDGTSFEDAGSTDASFGREQGRCFFTFTHVAAKSSSKIISRSEIQHKEWAREDQIANFDHNGRARGFVLKGATLAWQEDGHTMVSPCDAWIERWTFTAKEVPCVLLVEEQEWVSGMKVVGILQKSVLTTIPTFIQSPVPVSFLRAEYSCISRNASATYVSGLALKLLCARGARLINERSFKHLPGLRGVFIEESCKMDRIIAARDLTPGLCRTDTYPVLKEGIFAGRARILLGEMNIPLEKSAPRVLSSHMGPGCKRMRGSDVGRGQALEVTEKAITTTALRAHDGRSFEVNRPVEQTDVVRADYIRACGDAFELLNLGMLPE